MISELKKYADLRITPSRRKAVIWHTAGGWISNLLLIVQGLLLVPLYIEILGGRLYGFWLASGGVLAWLSMVDVGGGAITRVRCAASYGRNDLQGTINYFWHGAVITGLVVFTFCLACFFLAPWIPDFIHAEDAFFQILKNSLLLAGIAVALGFINSLLREFAAGCQRNGFPVVTQAIGDIAGILIIIVLLLKTQAGLYALPIGSLTRVVVPIILNSFFIQMMVSSTGCKVKWSKEIFRDYRTTTPALLAAKAAGSFSLQLPIVLITKWFGPEIGVAYSLGTRLLEILKQFINHPLAALYAATAHYLSDPKTGDKQKKTLFSNVAKGFAIGSSSVAIIYVIINRGFMHVWIPNIDYLGDTFSVMAAIGMVSLLFSTLLFTLMGSLGAMRNSGYYASVEKIVFAALCFILVKFLGVEGAPLAMILSTMFFQVFYLKQLKRLDPVVATELHYLRWLLLPQCLLLFTLGKTSQWFISENWVEFTSKTFFVSVPLALLVIILVPEVSKQAKKAFKNIFNRYI